MTEPSPPPAGRRDPSILTIQEIEALLRVDRETRPPEETTVAPAVLLVSRKDDDLEAVSHALRQRGVDFSVARNPFTALDHLRARDYAAVVSDFALWTGRGELLFDRLGRLDHMVTVIFVCDRGSSDVAAARTSPARRVLERPLSGDEVDLLIRELALVSRDGASRGDAPHGEASGDAARHDASALGPAAARSGLSPGATTENEDVAGNLMPIGAAPAAEAAWHRFFFEARRVLRGLRSEDARWNGVLDLLPSLLGGGAAARIAMVLSDDGRRGLRVAAIRAHVDGGDEARKEWLRDGLRGALRDLRDRLRDRALSVARPACCDLGAPDSPERAVACLPQGASSRNVLALLLPCDLPAASLPPAILDELAHLAGEIDARV